MDTLYVLALLVAVVAIYFFLGNSKGTKKKGSQKKGGPTALERKYKPFKLLTKTALTHNTYVFRFALDTPQHILGLPVGQHMRLKYTDDVGEDIIRSYTPTSSDDDVGFFELVIKVYPKGLMTNHLKNMNPGDTILAAGPIGKLIYTSPGKLTIKKKDRMVKSIGMIAGGTGITPMLQIVRDMAKHKGEDKTEVSMIFANVTEEDILCREELERYASTMPNFKVHYTLDRPGENWKGSKGFVTAEMIAAHLPGPADDSIVLMCGPPPMINFMEKNLAGLDYSKDQYYKF